MADTIDEALDDIADAIRAKTGKTNLMTVLQMADEIDEIPGMSAYDLAVKNGYVGTEKEWLATLKGEQGDVGPEGPGDHIVASKTEPTEENCHIWLKTDDNTVYLKAEDGSSWLQLPFSTQTFDIPIPINQGGTGATSLNKLVGTSELKDYSVGTLQMQNNAVGAAQINSGAIESRHWSDSFTLDVQHGGTGKQKTSDIGLYAYPVGSIYISINDTDPKDLFGGSWQRLATGITLWNAETGQNGGDSIAAGLPNIKGNTGPWDDQTRSEYIAGGPVYNPEWFGPFYDTGDRYYYDATSTYDTTCEAWYLGFDASRANAIYGNSTTVQPPAIAVYMWQRIA